MQIYVCVENYEEVELILRIAPAVTLVTPPQSACILGARYWKALEDLAGKQFNSAHFTLMVDCGSQAGTVMQALSMGLKHLICDVAPPALTGLQHMAALSGAKLETRPHNVLHFPACMAYIHKQRLTEEWFSSSQSPDSTPHSTEISYAY